MFVTGMFADRGVRKVSSASFKVGDRYTVTLTLPPAKPGTVVAATCEWSPSVPRSLNEAEIKDYKLGMRLAIDTLSRATGRQPILQEMS